MRVSLKRAINLPAWEDSIPTHWARRIPARLKCSCVLRVCSRPYHCGSAVVYPVSMV